MHIRLLQNSKLV